VVTGAGRGIGRAIALALAGEGANVVVNDIGGAVDGTGGSTSPADEVVAEIKEKGGTAIPNYDSVAEYESAGRIIKSCLDNFGRIDILVCVAGILRDRMCFNMTPEEWDAVIKVHLYGTFYCARHACVPMREQKWGRIIGVTSDAYRGTVGHVNYGAAKGGIVSLIRSMALELSRYGITCNCIAPVAATRMTLSDEVKEGFKKRLEAGLISQETYERLVNMPSPEFVAPLVVYLASDYGAGINGAVLGCGGGKISIHSVAEEVRVIYKDYRNEGPWTIEEMRRLIPRTIEPYCPPLKAVEVDWG
jgi:NAD(P)-dependent dehydrogenase (short-subunit alcohol dehydrogenase family)